MAEPEAGQPFDPSWIAAQRWFRAKQRPIAAVAEVDRAALGPAALGPATLVVLEVSYADGGPPDRYLAPQVAGREPADGDGAWARIADAIAAARTIPSDRGRFVATRARGFDDVASPVQERRLRVEQSNTSVVLDERLILKLYRLLEPGTNPEIEVASFLADAGFADTPALAGWLAYEPDAGEPSAAAMLQAFVPASHNGWEQMLAHVRHDPGEGIRSAAAIGALTRRMHEALASRPDDSAFPARPVAKAEAATWLAAAEEELDLAIGALSAVERDRLIAMAPTVRERLGAAFRAASGDELVSRVHGDYHLGQLLGLPDRYLVIDFEGEPARPLAARRELASPLRDVAGMLRSLDYAGRTADRSSPPAGYDADRWVAAARAAFLAAYGVGGPLVDAFELQKACYEVRYEAGNRPDWRWLPLEAIERLAVGSA